MALSLLNKLISFLFLLLSSPFSSLSHSTTLPLIKAVGLPTSEDDHDDAAAAVAGDPKDKCVYTAYVRTGSVWKGGTDSVIGATLAGADGSGVEITDLAAWGGLMGDGHDYYERGNLDIFSGRGPCLPSPPCWLNLTSDGTGPHHGWYCNYVEVATAGPHAGCAQTLFTVEQWLATDASPYLLYAVRDLCPNNSPPPDSTE